jgi:hypothetical protein
MSILSLDETPVEESRVDMGIFGEMVACATNAPKDYDYGYVIEVEDYDGERVVLVPTDKLPYQTGRYSSGLFQLKVIGGHNFVKTRIYEMVMTKLMG